jgi:tRNA1(Val) A37 N6-methylase TrmN6
MQMVRKDLQRIGRTIAPGSLSVIVANPPYIKEGAGRPSPDRLRRTARQAHPASLVSWLNLHRYLKNGGRYCLIFPAARLVHPYHDRPASLVLIEAVKNAGTGIEVLPSLIVHGQNGGYTEDMQDIYGLPTDD